MEIEISSYNFPFIGELSGTPNPFRNERAHCYTLLFGVSRGALFSVS